MNFSIQKKSVFIAVAGLALVGLSTAPAGLAAATTGFEGCIYGQCNGNSTVGCTASGSTCSTSNISNVANLIASFQGTTYELTQTKAGTVVSGSKGYLTLPNQVMGLIGNLITAGTITTASIGTTGVTSEFTVSGNTMTGHMVFSQNPTVSGTTYAYDMKLWICMGAKTTCTAASMFFPKIYMAWSVSSDGTTINKGILNMTWGQNTASGSPQGGMAVTYDVGTSATSRTVTATMFDASGGSAYVARFDATKSSSTLNLTSLAGWFNSLNSTTYVGSGGFSSSHRDAVSFNTSTLTGAYSGEGYNCPSWAGFAGSCNTTNGSPSVSSSATSDTPTAFQCFTAAATTNDYSYTPVLTGQTCTMTATYPAYSLTQLQTNVYSPQTAAVVGTTFMNGMATTPSNI